MEKNQQRHGKSIARENAVKIMYSQYIANQAQTVIEPVQTDELAQKMVDNIAIVQPQIDEYINKYLKKWSINQLNPVNLAILRISIYEIMENEVPNSVVVNEALELAKLYSDEKSKGFIHHILDKVIKERNE